MVSSNASFSYGDIMTAAAPSQPLFFQLYKNADDAVAEKRIRDAEQLGYKSIWLTVDAIVPGNRENDIKSSWILEELESGKSEVHVDGVEAMETGDPGLGTAGALIANDDRDMTWAKVRWFKKHSIPILMLLDFFQTVPWLRSVTKLPIVIKGKERDVTPMLVLLTFLQAFRPLRLSILPFHLISDSHKASSRTQC